MQFNIPYLYQNRQGTYYLRLVLSSGLQCSLGKREIRRSLKTKDKQKALLIALCFGIAMEDAKKGQPWIERRHRLQEYFEEEVARITNRLHQYGPDDFILHGDHMTIEERAAEDPSIEEDANYLIERHGWEIQPTSVEYFRLKEELVRIFHQALERVRRDSEPLLSYNRQWPSHSKQSEKPLLRAAITKYVEEKERSGAWSEKTAAQNLASLEQLIAIVGNLPTDRVGAETARRYKDTLLKLPPNAGKDPRYRDLCIREILALEPEKTISTETFNNILGRVTAFFEWAHRHHYVDQNYFSGLKIRQKRKVSEARDIYSDEDLEQLFSSPIHQQLVFKHAYYYWLPILGLYTGARLEELCQLHLEDLQLIGGVNVLNINDLAEKKLKTASSARIIPIHPRLIDLGLLRYRDSLLARDVERLFPELKRQRDGYSQAASKWFARFRSKQGIGTGVERKDFHSFRHTFATELKRKEVSEPVAASLLGHSSEGITFERYGKGYSIETLLKSVNLLEFKLQVKPWESR